jgi:hypothetical protein
MWLTIISTRNLDEFHRPWAHDTSYLVPGNLFFSPGTAVTRVAFESVACLLALETYLIRPVAHIMASLCSE